MLRRAADCEKAAASTANRETRETLLYLAARWRALAADAEKKLNND
jgi:hypothetical protein